MISAVCVFGPLHGKVVNIEGIPTDQPIILAEEEPPRFFLDDEKMPIHDNIRRHMYECHDVFEQGVEECAVLFHKENCCNRTYEHSEAYKRERPRGR